MNLYQKLHAIQEKVNGLGKDKSTQTYRYVTGDKVLGNIKPLMNEHGIILKQEIISIDNTRQDYVVGVSKDMPNGRPKSEILSKVMMRFTWIDCESGEKDENVFGANGQNDWDKGIGSALTYAERYFLLKFFHIATDEDDIDNPDRKMNDFNESPISVAIGNIRLCKTIEDLKALKATLSKEVKENKAFITAATARYNQLSKPLSND